MSKSQRTKGAAGERELAAILTDTLGTKVTRKLGQARDGGDDIQTGKFKWEVKRRAKIAVYEFMDQITAACKDGETPVVAMRADHKGWLVMMKLEDALPLIQGELIGEQK
ncbi:MAG: putative PDDEXK endonuclease [Methylococcales bacterium]